MEQQVYRSTEMSTELVYWVLIIFRLCVVGFGCVLLVLVGFRLCLHILAEILAGCSFLFGNPCCQAVSLRAVAKAGAQVEDETRWQAI